MSGCTKCLRVFRPGEVVYCREYYCPYTIQDNEDERRNVRRQMTLLTFALIALIAATVWVLK